MGSRTLAAICLSVLLSGCATVPRATVPPLMETSLEGLCQKYNMDCRWDGVAQTVKMSYGGKEIRGLIGSNMMMVAGQKVALSAPLVRRCGMVVVPSDFERVVIGPGARPQEDYQKGVAASRLSRIVIDAGHGGQDPGAIGRNGIKEKEIVLDIALRVAKNFEAAGVDVVLTRDRNEFITLAGRTEIASQPEIDLFVSVHANAHKNKRSHGVEVYYAGLLSLDDKTDAQRLANQKKLLSRFKMNAENDDVRRIVTDLLSSYKARVSPGLAEAISQGLSTTASGGVRGSKPQRFFVLRNTLIPAVLVEAGFITNPQEAALLGTAGYRQRVADGISKSILRYFYAARL